MASAALLFQKAAIYELGQKLILYRPGVDGAVLQTPLLLWADPGKASGCSKHIFVTRPGDLVIPAKIQILLFQYKFS